MWASDGNASFLQLIWRDDHHWKREGRRLTSQTEVTKGNTDRSYLWSMLFYCIVPMLTPTLKFVVLPLYFLFCSAVQLWLMGKEVLHCAFLMITAWIVYNLSLRIFSWICCLKHLGCSTTFSSWLKPSFIIMDGLSVESQNTVILKTRDGVPKGMGLELGWCLISNSRYFYLNMSSFLAAVLSCGWANHTLL